MNRGIALISVLLVSSLVFVVGLGLTLVMSVVQLVTRNHRDVATLQAAADAGIDLAAAALAGADWQAVLGGAMVADAADGAPAGTRLVEGATIDLSAETHRQNCGQPAPCAVADRSSYTIERPWGQNNPFWQLFVYGRLSDFVPLRYPSPIYLLVWVADDGRETDGRPELDGGEPPGHHVLRARAMAVGRDGMRAVVDAELVRICLEGRPTCEPGIRVQSQRETRHALP